ncbi:MAG: CbtB domain-containing protein [Candidatus Bathyarchaeia archaeon]
MDNEESHEKEASETEITLSESTLAKIKLQLPVAMKFGIILAASLSVIGFVGVDQNVLAHELNHDVRHALAFACH